MQSSPKPLPDKTTDSSYWTSLSSFLQKPVEQKKIEAPETHLPSEPAKKPRRDKSSFSQNITASLALPKTPKMSECKNTDEGYLTLLANSISSLLFKPPPTIPEQKIEEKNNPTIDIKIKELSKKIIPLKKQIQELREKIKKDDNLSAKIKKAELDNIPLQTKKAELDNLLLQEIELLEHEIREHAARRVDLFFYLLIAVYNTNVRVEKAFTAKQHGSGNEDLLTQACHSSLFPSVTLIPPPPSNWSIFFTTTPPVLAGTYFEEALNMTVELPKVVNDFDGHLEGRHGHTRYVEFCLDVLNSAAKGEIDPIQAMNRFFRHINAFFEHYKEEYILKKKGETPLTNEKIWQYEREGTFQAADINSLTIKNEYLYSILRLNPHEIRSERVPILSGLVLARNYRLIQNEILTQNSLASTNKVQLK